jgi:hypothetical protein
MLPLEDNEGRSPQRAEVDLLEDFEVVPFGIDVE